MFYSCPNSVCMSVPERAYPENAQRRSGTEGLAVSGLGRHAKNCVATLPTRWLHMQVTCRRVGRQCEQTGSSVPQRGRRLPCQAQRKEKNEPGDTTDTSPQAAWLDMTAEQTAKVKELALSKLSSTLLFFLVTVVVGNSALEKIACSRAHLEDAAILTVLATVAIATVWLGDWGPVPAAATGVPVPQVSPDGTQAENISTDAERSARFERFLSGVERVTDEQVEAYERLPMCGEEVSWAIEMAELEFLRNIELAYTIAATALANRQSALETTPASSRASAVEEAAAAPEGTGAAAAPVAASQAAPAASVEAAPVQAEVAPVKAEAAAKEQSKPEKTIAFLDALGIVDAPAAPPQARPPPPPRPQAPPKARSEQAPADSEEESEEEEFTQITQTAVDTMEIVFQLTEVSDEMEAQRTADSVDVEGLPSFSEAARTELYKLWGLHKVHIPESELATAQPASSDSVAQLFAAHQWGVSRKLGSIPREERTYQVRLPA